MFRKSKVIWNLNYKRNLNRIIAWRISAISDRSFIYLLSLFVGLFSGLAAIILKRLVYFVAEILTDWFDIDGISYWYLVYPLIGITLTVFFVKYIVKDNKLYIVGDEALEFANMFNKETRRPLSRGVISPTEKEALIKQGL